MAKGLNSRFLHRNPIQGTCKGHTGSSPPACLPTQKPAGSFPTNGSPCRKLESDVAHRQERYDEKLIQILHSACGIFARKGYHHASVRDVAAATGVSPAGLYYYFRSKEELLFLILNHALTSLLRQVTKEAGGASGPEDRIRAIIQTHLAFSCSHPHEMRILAREWDALTGGFHRKVLRRQREYAAMVIRTLRELRPDAPKPELRAATMSLFGMLNWVHQWSLPHRDLPVEEMGKHFSRIFLRGFLSRDEGEGARALEDIVQALDGRES